jgi:hypothetical protein
MSKSPESALRNNFLKPVSTAPPLSTAALLTELPRMKIQNLAGIKFRHNNTRPESKGYTFFFYK